MARVTPATRAAERAGIDFRVHEYAHVAGAEYGAEAAAQLGVEAAARVQDAGRLDRRRAPRRRCRAGRRAARPEGARGTRSARSRPVWRSRTDAQRLTGYVLGGISPLGQKRRLAAVVDASASAYASVFVSGGRRGLEIELAPRDLVQLTDAALAEIARW